MVAPGAQGIQAQVSDQPGCTFTWAVSGGTIDAGAATRAVTCTAGSGGTFSLSVTVTNAAGSTAQGTYNLSIAAPPQPLDVTVTEELAPGMAEATASVPEIAGATYNWTLTGGTITAGAHGPMVTFTTADTAPAGVQALAANCGTVILTHVLQHPNGSKYGSTKTIPVNCDPNANVRAPLTVAPSQAGLVASVHEQNHCTYSWTVVNGAIASGQGTHRITFAAGSTGTITLTCKVTNQSGNSKTGSAIVIIVESTPSISYTPSSHTLVRGAAVSPIVPTNTGGAATSWSIAPALPTGLAFSPSTGTINGSPQTLLPPTAFTVTAANAGGSGTAQLNLAVNDVPSSISYTPSVVVLTVGSILQPLAPTNTGGAITSWSVTPALPSGLTFSTITGVFAGTPVALSPATTYTVTATYVGGTATAQVTITVNDKLPIITYPCDPAPRPDHHRRRGPVLVDHARLAGGSVLQHHQRSDLWYAHDADSFDLLHGQGQQYRRRSKSQHLDCHHRSSPKCPRSNHVRCPNHWPPTCLQSECD
jgi:hypothetical protein